MNIFRKDLYSEKQREAILGLVMFIINVGSYLFILPVAQSSANHHMNNGPIIGVIYFIATLSLIVYINYQPKMSYLSRIVISVSCINFVYFAWKLFHLVCAQCLAGG